ncbi:hypothetical protein PsorP6_012616 [Peronosclerospora sorghi]|uniref:Uncharacterized protein n=1 Tax=Peronosclerospora sorghi TaxID=230839 RepID=A0ACC0WIH9_9STRA|nr:hypothetical protein PsorP6_012616 [Peronosclerospora sorghi]
MPGLLSCGSSPLKCSACVGLGATKDEWEWGSRQRISRTAGVADGTVTLYTDRVISALVRLASEFVRWPQPEERREISRPIAQRSGIVGAVGIVDGTHINFAQRPAIDREVFFSRKHRYGFNAQVIVDDRGMIRFFQSGLPASLYDSTAFTFTPISKQPEQFFSENEFLLGDSGFPSIGSVEKISSIFVLPQSAGNVRISHITDPYCLASLSMETVTFIFAIEPEVRVIYRWYRADAITPDDPVLPTLAFAWVSFPGSSRALSPVLARGWDNRVQFLKVVFPGGKNHLHTRHGFPTFDEHDQIESSSAVMAAQWLGDQVVVYLNSP